ncbi:hypothetical protein MYCTH_2301177 [Thermothelomyces thermophilus ATCC 42464]|uniref:FAD/NAD(P)-binding domain-containing protein n=1 Tax=Thermothelomyces thermophilus (strain ATCC 42464 / BCRC 31852 / DSM 1799) TaxID=573729 RepID=G2Q967_THET4|nr:uncharacterized protein MYCTH_2301177 [Thermothelomyces thermophilus ATCC 42464]AEO56359.1 hypothetical protein MYCTH_2301177 [Thermothelomyces thermophilus ATCC 42464]
MVRTVVILGASYAGIPIAHYLLKHTATKTKDLKVIIVAPNTHLYWVFASIRGIVPNRIGENKIFLPIAPTFAKYPSDQYELVHGVAKEVVPDANVVEVRGNDGSARTIQYDELVIATGSSFKNGMPFKNLSSTEETKTALREWAKRIESAKSIVVAGAGATGVEIAGELGQEYAVPGKKQITLVCDDDLPLSAHLRRDVRETTKDELERLKVKVITNARLATAPSAAPKTSTLTLTLTKTSASSADEAPTTLQADLLIPTYGITPNTAFLPPSLLDSRGHVRQTARLRAEGYDNIFVAGDAGNLESHQAVHADSQAVHIARLLEARILGGVPGSPSLKPDEEEEDYKPIDKVMFAVTLGRNRGTGQVGSWKLWSLLVWFMKGRYLGTNYAPEYARGERTLRLKSW